MPRCYDFGGRGPNLFWCGLTPYEVSFYNGTVEGQAAVDTVRNVLYLGRGDGKLYAIDPDPGCIRWRYHTFNPALPGDPDGGSSSPDEAVRVQTHEVGVIPEGTTPLFYALKGPTTQVAVADPPLPPSTFRLGAPYPNPFSTTAVLSVEMARPGLLRLSIIDVLGRTVRMLVEAQRPAGRHTFVWDGADAAGRRMPGGVYFARLLVADEDIGQAYGAVRKLVMMR